MALTWGIYLTGYKDCCQSGVWSLFMAVLGARESTWACEACAQPMLSLSSPQHKAWLLYSGPWGYLEDSTYRSLPLSLGGWVPQSPYLCHILYTYWENSAKCYLEMLLVPLQFIKRMVILSSPLSVTHCSFFPPLDAPKKKWNSNLIWNAHFPPMTQTIKQKKRIFFWFPPL